MAQPDLSKIVSIIMENPKLVEEIRDMISKSEVSDSPVEEKNELSETVAEKEISETAAQATYKSVAPTNSHATRRNELLRAMQPYVSKERSRAIESMITIADLLLAFKEK